MAVVLNTTKDNMDRNDLIEKQVNDAWRRSNSQEIDASGAAVIEPYVNEILLNNTTQITATIANANKHPGLMVIKQLDAGTAGHTVTLTKGSVWNGTIDTNTITLNAQDEMIAIHFDAYGNGMVIENVGTVGLTAV